MEILVGRAPERVSARKSDGPAEAPAGRYPAL